jgi:hypothetical protein
MGMTPPSGYHFKPNVKNDIIALANRHNLDSIFTFHPGRTQSFQAKDVFAAGMEKLGQTSQIKDFLARTSEASLDPELTDMDEGDMVDVEMDELDDEMLDDFEGPNDLLQ